MISTVSLEANDKVLLHWSATKMIIFQLHQSSKLKRKYKDFKICIDQDNYISLLFRMWLRNH